MLTCIRCGSCLNVCPVYRKTGGAAYSDVYSGPMGAVLVPLLAGLSRNCELPHASSLCGACFEACPVKIPLPELLLELRRDLVEEGVASRTERILFSLWSLAWSTRVGYGVSTRVARAAAPLAARLWPGRTLPPLGPRYRDRR
jgi:L-lactate dehydrogenase complex protein LldF